MRLTIIVESEGRVERHPYKNVSAFRREYEESGMPKGNGSLCDWISEEYCEGAKAFLGITRIL